MKTSSNTNTGIGESGINIRLNNKSFLEHAKKSKRFRFKKLIRQVDQKEQRLITTLGLEDYPLCSKMQIHPEFIAYSYTLYGLARKLLVYIIFYEADPRSCRFWCDEEMIKRFHRFCFLMGEEMEGEQTIIQAITTLKRKNTIVAINEATYMLNPLIASGTNQRRRRKLVDTYSLYLEQNGLDSSLHFYPAYSFGL